MKKLIYFFAAQAALLLFGAAAASQFSTDEGVWLLSEYKAYVVKLTPVNNFRSGGTGFELRALSGKTYTITNGHVCKGGEAEGTLAAHISGWTKPYIIRILETNKLIDLCILEGLPSNKGIEISTYFNPVEQLYVLGHPKLRPLALSTGFVTSRTDIVVPNKSRFTPNDVGTHTMDVYSTNIKVYPGNSGSPVLNTEGNVVGVVFAMSIDTNYAHFVPLETLKEFVSKY